MGKIKIRVKEGSKGKPISKEKSTIIAKSGEQGKLLYRPKAKLNVHIKDGRK